MTFLLNAWYPAAWDYEIEKEKLFPRKLLNQNILFFRNLEGIAQGVSDRCPHRFAPLHMGHLVGDSVRCAYHGLEFNGKGECVHNPHGDGKIPKAAKIKGYKLVERYGIVWIWMGAEERANPDDIPIFEELNTDDYYIGRDYLHARANYVLETDNIMDLSHIEYLHPSTLGSDSVKRATTTVEQDGNTVWSKRFIEGEIMPDFLYDVFDFPAGTVMDRWLEVRWDAPATLLLNTGATPTGKSREEGSPVPTVHLFTPETETTTHYWFSICFPKYLEDVGELKAKMYIQGLRVPFETEDLPMLEAQQKSMGDEEFWDLKPILLIGDAGAIRARRILDQMIADEQNLDSKVSVSGAQG
ncbi:Toluene-4-sulfonate monooxygenase system iron-sulfur subunit TsaM1 [Pseudomonas sp. IT-P100]|uniref:Rieske 2Fe-2S domain-containing protein n=1 Tax=Pseudomonas sp. IT-P100 TaxID=3026452 RepID=UPI0039E06CCC